MDHLSKHLSEWTKDELLIRLNEVRDELKDIYIQQRLHPLTTEDKENFSDKYIMSLAWDIVLPELKKEEEALEQVLNSLHK